MSERDIVERLRARRPRHNQVSVDAGLFTEIDEAAAEILRLRAELADAKRAGFEKAREIAARIDDDPPDIQDDEAASCLRRLADALEEATKKTGGISLHVSLHQPETD